jgi:hypothetical protein
VTRAKISEYSATANDNTDVNGVNIAENCPPSSMNNMGREIMAALKRFQTGSDGDGVTVGGSLVVSGSTTVNTFNVDVISEKTSAAGVTIDGVLLKDNGVVTGAGTVSAPVYSTTGDTNTGIFFPAADTIAFAEGGAEAMRITSDGFVGLGTGTPSQQFTLTGSQLFNNNQEIRFKDTGGTERTAVSLDSSNNLNIGTSANGNLRFINGSTYTERMRITSAGEVLVGTTTGDANSRLVIQNVNSTEWGDPSIVIRNSSGNRTFVIFNGDITGINAGQTVAQLAKRTTTSRSLNASGTLNASGADYAEYMTKAGDFNIAKGDIVGIDSDGKLTNVFNNAIAFVVKSTDPSFVGGDGWGAGYENDEEGLEEARQKVDRIAFAGQVPVNVTSALSGQYIVPVENNGGIAGIAVNEADMTLAQYIKAVGKVIATEADGRARIIVKLG